MVTARFPPFMGGVETHTYEVSRRLAAMGVDVLVLTTDPTGKLPRREEVEGVAVRRVTAWPAHSDLHFAPGLARDIHPGPHTIVHCQGYHTLVAPLSMAAAAMRRIPFVVTLHSGGHSSSLRNAIRPAQTAILGPLLRRARKLIAVSGFESELFQARLRLPPERFVVIPNGADMPGDNALRMAVRENLIVSVGRLERYKGHHRVIATLPYVMHSIPDVRLLIVGSGPFEADLRRVAERARVADRVEIRAIPSERRSELASILGRAGLVTLLSEYESQGISVMEALAMGAPVLASDTSALAELGRRGLAQTVDLAASDREIAEAMVRTMRSGNPVAPPLPTWDDAAKALRVIYTSVLDDRQRPKRTGRGTEQTARP
jgi:glycosyltransferase involved in cell wall biosynthesis